MGPIVQQGLAQLRAELPGQKEIAVKMATLSVMVNFIAQLGWATGRPDIWVSIILGVSVGCFRRD
jgi:hypothetical protein